MPIPERPLHERRLWEFQALRDLAVLAMLVGVLWLGWRLSAITVPLMVGLGLAYVAEPLIAWLTRRIPRLSRMKAVLLLVAGIALSGALLLALTVPPLVRQAVSLANNSENHVLQVHAWAVNPARPEWLRSRAVDLEDSLARVGLLSASSAAVSATVATPVVTIADSDEARLRALVREEIAANASQSTGSSMASRVGGILGALSLGVGAAVGTVVSLLLFVAIAAVSAVSFSLAWPTVLASAHDLLPATKRAHILGLLGRMDHTVSSFVRGRLTVAAIVASIYAAGWTIVGVPYGLVLGLAVGALSLVPYLAAVGLPLAWILVALRVIGDNDGGSWYVSLGADGAPVIHWWLVLVLPWAVNLTAQTLEDYVLSPLIQGKATELHPAAIMVAVIAGGLLAGLYGMLLAVPAAACGRILLTAELLPRLKAWAEDNSTNKQAPPP